MTEDSTDPDISETIRHWKKETAETRKAVEENKCPKCGRNVRRNSKIPGWYQCSQYGGVRVRKEPRLPRCLWQGFTE